MKRKLKGFVGVWDRVDSIPVCRKGSKVVFMAYEYQHERLKDTASRVWIDEQGEYLVRCSVQGRKSLSLAGYVLAGGKEITQ